jgi:hypothetical protein
MEDGMPREGPINQGPTITIQYSLTRLEIAGYFLRSLPKSPRLMAIVLGTSLAVGFVPLAIEGALARALTAGDILNCCGIALGVFSLFVFLVFIQGKTMERTLSVSGWGISTSIGNVRGAVPWTKIAAVKSVGKNVLLVGSTGNSFFVPMRAFEGSEQYVEFLRVTQEWLKSSR